MIEPQGMDGAINQSTSLYEFLHSDLKRDGGPENYKKWAKQYDTILSEPAGYVGYKSVIKKWMDYSSLQDGLVHKMFDAGCGTGFIGEYLFTVCTRGSVDLFGGDLSPDMLNEARKKGIYNDLRVVNLKEVLPYEEESFDSVVSAGVFVEGHCGPECLKNIERVLKKGHYFITTVRKPFYDEHKEEWDRQIKECGFELLESDKTPYAGDAEALMLVLKKP